jgi:hypothetical protein
VPCTDKQLKYVDYLRGDSSYAAKLSKESCSLYIDRLKRGEGVTSPTVAPEPQPEKSDPKFDMFRNLMQALPDGRYAIRADETEPYTFFRVKIHTRGKRVGCMTIQTQHSERLMNAAIRWRSGQWFFERNKQTIIDLMLFVCLDPKTAGMNYAQELGRCCICGKELTDERSRWYGIGPDCETRHGSIIEWVNEVKGMTYEQHHARLFA